MTTPKKPDFDRLALRLMFVAGPVDEALAEHGVEYRTGKTVEDVKKSVKKALKNGHGKTETELSMFSVYLSQILKATS